jgi:hypothetical protein
MTYEEYAKLEREDQVRACLNDLALVATTQQCEPHDDLHDLPAFFSWEARAFSSAAAAETAAVHTPRSYKSVSQKSGLAETTVRQVLEAYRELEARRRT